LGSLDFEAGDAKVIRHFDCDGMLLKIVPMGGSAGFRHRGAGWMFNAGRNIGRSERAACSYREVPE
jgi:hypothetical protein